MTTTAKSMVETALRAFAPPVEETGEVWAGGAAVVVAAGTE